MLVKVFDNLYIGTPEESFDGYYPISVSQIATVGLSMPVVNQTCFQSVMGSLNAALNEGHSVVLVDDQNTATANWIASHYMATNGNYTIASAFNSILKKEKAANNKI